MSIETMPGDPIPAKAAPRRGAWVRKTWTTIVTWIRKESAATEALILAFIALGIAFGWWHWTDAQTGAVIGIAAALLGMFVRSQVTPLIQPRTRGQRLVPAPDEPAAAPAPQAGR